LSEWFGNQEDAKVTWPEFEMIETKVRLASRKR
jgi:hypothetical protein